MTYQELLTDEKWLNKRKIILERDKYSCQMNGCSKIQPDLGKLKHKEKLNDLLKITNDTEPRLVNTITNNTTSIIIENKYRNLTGRDFTETIPIISKLPEIMKESEIMIYYFEPIYESSNGKSLLSQILLKKYAVYGEVIQSLNVHHKKYIKNRKPWDYDDNDLITYCCDCHLEVHNNDYIPVLDEKGNVIGTTEKCWKCNGAGHLKEYNYYYAGICFSCLGEGITLSNLL